MHPDLQMWKEREFPSKIQRTVALKRLLARARDFQDEQLVREITDLVEAEDYHRTILHDEFYDAKPAIVEFNDVDRVYYDATTGEKYARALLDMLVHFYHGWLLHEEEGKKSSGGEQLDLFETNKSGAQNVRELLSFLDENPECVIYAGRIARQILFQCQVDYTLHSLDQPEVPGLKDLEEESNNASL